MKLRHIALAALALGFLPTSAKTEDADVRWVRRTILVERCEFFGSCARYRYFKWERQRERAHAYYRPRSREAELRYYAPPRRDDDDDRGVSCKDMRRTVGTEHASEKGAREAAARSWSALVRYDLGEKWMDISFARGITYRCNRSSTNETAAGRVAESVAGAYYMRCAIEARPCQPPKTDGDDR